LVVVLGLAIIACLLADIVWYEVGRRWGDQISHFIYALALELSPDNFRLARNPGNDVRSQTDVPVGSAHIWRESALERAAQCARRDDSTVEPSLKFISLFGEFAQRNFFGIGGGNFMRPLPGWR
jgi:hypothetical protein